MKHNESGYRTSFFSERGMKWMIPRDMRGASEGDEDFWLAEMVAE